MPHRALRWIVVRTVVDFTSAEIVGRKLKIAAANKKPRSSFEAGVSCLKMAWR